MQSNGAKLAIAGAAVVVVVVLFVVLKGGDDNGSSIDDHVDHLRAGRASPRSRSRTAQPVGGIQDLTFTEGDDIRFKVDSDVSDEVHFHGYDVGKDVKAGGSVTFDVPATITGVFEVELESRAEQIAEITVNPS